MVLVKLSEVVQNLEKEIRGRIVVRASVIGLTHVTIDEVFSKADITVPTISRSVVRALARVVVPKLIAERIAHMLGSMFLVADSGDVRGGAVVRVCGGEVFAKIRKVKYVGTTTRVFAVYDFVAQVEYVVTRDVEIDSSCVVVPTPKEEVPEELSAIEEVVGETKLKQQPRRGKKKRKEGEGAEGGGPGGGGPEGEAGAP